MSSGYIYMWSLEDRLCVSNFRQGVHSYVWVLVQDELSEKWERTRFNLLGHVLPPLSLDSAWFSQTLVLLTSRRLQHVSVLDIDRIVPLHYVSNYLSLSHLDCFSKK